MATTYSLNRVTAGETILESDHNTLASTVEGALNSLDGGNIQAGTLSGLALAANSIAGTVITTGTLPGNKIVAGGVGTTQLANSGVTTGKILDANVTTAKIADANVTIAKLGTGVCLMAVGSYTGNGAASRAITGIGWTPSLLIITREEGSHNLYLKNSSMLATMLINSGGTGMSAVNYITSFDADGFTVTVNLNTAGVEWTYMAFGVT